MTTVYIYTATWCKRCHQLKPLYDEVIDDNPDIKFIFMDVDNMDEDCSILPKVPSVKIDKGNGKIPKVLEGFNEIEGSLEMAL